MVEIDSDHYGDEQNPTFIDNNVDVTMETKAKDKSPRKTEDDVTQGRYSKL